MPTFTFEGFTEGSLVALSVAQGAQGAAGSVQEWRLSNTNTATIDFTTLTHAEVVAPAGVWFEATGFNGFDVTENVSSPQAYDPAAHDIFLMWDFDDPGTFTAPLNMPPVWNNRNVDYGKKVYHVFETPGTYTVQLTGIDRNGTTGSRMASVVVRDPNDVYPGTRTICVSQSGDFTGAPAGSQQAVSLEAARTALLGLGQPGRILLRRGETFSGFQFRIPAALGSVYVADFGPSGDPKPEFAITSSAAFFVEGSGVPTCESFIYSNLRFQGEWDAARETGDPRGSSISFSNMSDYAGTGWFATIYQCEFDGLSALFPIQGSRSHCVGVVDCDITNWQDYGIGAFGQVYGLDKRLAIVGCAVHQKENACTSSAGKIGLANDHGPLRNEGENELIISCSDFYSANQWFTGDDSPQPCLRLFTAGDGNPGGWFLNANRVVCEGGGEAVVKLDGQNGGTPERPGNHVFDKMILVADYATRRMIELNYGGTTLRNVLAIYPSIASVQGAKSGFFAHSNDNNTAANQSAVMQIYNCTTLNLLGSAGFPESENASNFANRTLQNAIHHQPNLGTPIVPDAPIDLTQPIPGFTPRNRGKRSGVEKISTTVNVAPGGSFTIGYPTGTGASDFSAGGRHTVKIENDYYFSYRGQCALSFGGSAITVTNTSGQTWSGTARLGLDQETLATNPSFGTPSSLPLPVPQGARSADGPLQARTHLDTTDRIRVQGAV